MAGVSSETHWRLSSCFFITKFFTGCYRFSELMGSVILILLPTFYEKFYFFFYVRKYSKLSLLKMFKFKFKFWHSRLTYYWVVCMLNFELCNYSKETLFLEWLPQLNRIWILYIHAYQIWIWIQLKCHYIFSVTEYCLRHVFLERYESFRSKYCLHFPQKRSTNFNSHTQHILMLFMKRDTLKTKLLNVEALIQSSAWVSPAI